MFYARKASLQKQNMHMLILTMKWEMLKSWTRIVSILLLSLLQGIVCTLVIFFSAKWLNSESSIFSRELKCSLPIMFLIFIEISHGYFHSFHEYLREISRFLCLLIPWLICCSVFSWIELLTLCVFLAEVFTQACEEQLGQQLWAKDTEGRHA